MVFKYQFLKNLFYCFSNNCSLNEHEFFMPNIRNEFELDPNLTFINHGSYGTVPIIILNKKQELQRRIEKCPDAWFRYDSQSLWNSNLNSLALFLNISNENLVFTFNTTDAINCVLKSINLTNSKDAILATNFTYGAIQNSIDFISKYKLQPGDQTQIFYVNIQLPIKTVDQLIQQFKLKLDEIINEKNLNLKLCVIDHISSGVPLLYPLDSLCRLIRSYEIDNVERKTKILIDGAHSIGHIKLDLIKLDCDFYVSNLHKWFFAPKGCTFLYFRNKQEAKALLEPNFISNGYRNSPSISYNFFYRGTYDMTNCYVVKECIDFYATKLGGYKKVYEYCSNLLNHAINLLTMDWKTEELDICDELKAPFMRLVRLPDLKSFDKTPTDARKLMQYLYENFKIISVMVCLNNKLYCRLSCFVYNSIDDYDLLRKVIKNLT